MAEHVRQVHLTTKQTDFGVTRVRYDENGLIDELGVRSFDGELLQDPHLCIRSQPVGDM